jgi:isoleucyl-tRNA synthetase
MHKSWGNAIDFDEAAERIGVDVMRWTFAKARPEDNILFGWHTADEARRELLVLWNVYAFFVTYARLAGWTPRHGIDQAVESAAGWPVLDRWILSRTAGVAAAVGDRLDEYDSRGAAAALSTFIDDLSTWYLRRSRDRMRAGAEPGDRDAAFATLHAALVTTARALAPLLPFLAETMYQNLMVAVIPPDRVPDSVHLTRWPAGEMASFRDPGLEAAMTTARRAVELVRTLRSGAGLKVRQPLARMWLALPGGGLDEEEALLALVADEVNVKAIERIDDESELVERRVKPLLPRIGKRLGSQIPAVMAAARDGAVEIADDGSVRLAGVTLGPDEVEILATPRPGTAVAHDEGLVVVIDTEITPELQAEGDRREVLRAVNEVRKLANLEVDQRLPELKVHGLSADLVALLEARKADFTADAVVVGPLEPDDVRVELELSSGPAAIGAAVSAAATAA